MIRYLAYISLIFTLLFVLAVLALLFLAPDVDPLRYGISFYALTRYGFVIDVALVLVGVSGIALSIALWRSITSRSGRIGLLLLIAGGLTIALAGVFPVDAPGSPATTSGSIHNLAGLGGPILIIAALMLIELPRPSGGDPVRHRSSTYWLAWLLLVFSVLIYIFNTPLLHSMGIGGAIQRLYWLVLVLWLVLKALEVLRQAVSAQTNDSRAT